MSEIANALKKIKKTDKSVVFNYGAFSKYSSFTLNNVYVILLLITVVIIFAYYFVNQLYFKKSEKVVNKITVSDVEKLYNQKLTLYKNKSKVSESDVLSSYLIKEDYVGFEAALKKVGLDGDLLVKYNGIYRWLITKEIALAKNYFEEYMKKYPSDPVVGSMLAEIYMYNGDLKGAYNIFEKIEGDDPYLLINKAVLNEKLGEFGKAFDYYNRALPQIDNNILKFRLKVKLETLKMFKAS